MDQLDNDESLHESEDCMFEQYQFDGDRSSRQEDYSKHFRSAKYRIYRKLEQVVDQPTCRLKTGLPRAYLDLLDQVQLQLQEIKHCREHKDKSKVDGETLLELREIEELTVNSIERDPWMAKIFHTYLGPTMGTTFAGKLGLAKEFFLQLAAEEKRKKKKKKRRRREDAEEEQNEEEEVYEPRLEEEWLCSLESELRGRLK